MRVFYFFLLLNIATFITAQELDIPLKTYHAQKVNPSPPEIDGKADDVMWLKTEAGEGFVQFDPIEGDPPSEKTYFKISYDEKNLYVLINSFDSETNKVAARLSRRDDVGDSDLVGIILDTYFDRRTGFKFSVNAAGVKKDAIYSNDSDNEDDTWDPVWEVVTNVDDSGWVAEMRIPFNQLRFPAKEQQIWGLEVFRYIHRKQEIIHWQLIPKNSPGFVSYFGQLEGIKNIPSPKRIEILPYTVSNYQTYEKEEDNPFSHGHDLSATGGLDGKIGLKGNITVDFTVNPDFGQVEADPSVVNLTAFETHFEEKRPFFIEGKNIFQFPLGIGDGDFARETLFYSRRIGRTPQHEPDIGDDEFIDTPGQTSIIAAGKLSGKTSGGWSIGALDAITAEETAYIDSLSKRRSEVVEPFTNYFIGRLQKDFSSGNTYVGGIVTSTNRNINKTYLEYINKSAYTAGLDFNHQWSNKTYFLNTNLAFSHIKGHKDALLEVQTASARYYQRPDANYVTLDSNRTSLSGHGGTINIGKQGNSKWLYVLGGVWRSPGLELNDVGYLRQADQAVPYIWVGYNNLNPVSIFRRIYLNLNHWHGWNFGGEKLFAGENINGGFQFLNYWGINFGIDREEAGLSKYALRGGPSLRYEGVWCNWFGFYSDARKMWRVEYFTYNQLNDDKISKYGEHYFELFFKPTNRFDIFLEPFYRWNLNNLQYIDTMEKNGEDRYIMGKIDQKTFGLVLRLNFCLTPELSIQYYGQPFISAGNYTQFKRIINPRASKYEDRFYIFADDEISYNPDNEEYEVDEDRNGEVDYTFELPDFNFKQFRSNLVIRWEYRPGSQLYLVWSQELSNSDSYGDFSLKRDFQDLFTLYPYNIFLIKLNYWFSM